jgi:hypothetical protein
MTSPRKKLNEKELGSLYITAETPLIIDRLIKQNQYTDTDIADIHKSLSKHAPDMAIIAASLSGNILANYLQNIDNEDLQVLATELKHLSINSVEEVGRIWIDACRYGIHNDDDIHDIVHQASDILCIFSSVFMEIAEICNGLDDVCRAIAASLMYQCEAHSDNAQSLLTNAAPKPQKTDLNAIPLPKELQDHHYTDNIVTFTLFGEQRV